MYGSFTLNQQKVQKLATQRAAQSIIESKATPQKMNDSQSTLGGANKGSRTKPLAESSFIQPNRENIYDVEVEEIDDELIEINQSPIDLESDRPTKP